MNRSASWTFRPFVVALALAFFALGLSIAPAAHAQGKVEAAAKALQKKAMEDDYLTTEFSKAQEKLEKAIGQCGTDKCSAPLRARLKRDLGVVLIGGGIDKDKGIASFVDALKIEPGLALDADVKTKELDAAFAEAKKKATGGGGSKPAAGGQPQGDFEHTPTVEQQVRTPIPVYVEYAGEEQLVRVVLRYKGFGMTEWKTVELRKMGEKGWGGLIPCGDVQQGEPLYYLQGFNANNDAVATGGDRNTPYRVPVVTDKVADPPHLPGASPPSQCADTGDCPPNFPGCKKAPVGAAANASTDPSKIEPTGKDGGETCEDDSDCKSNSCKKSKCTDYEGGEKKAPRFWLGLSAALDYTFVPSAEDVCKLKKPEATPLNDSNYYCTRSDGSDYPSRSPSNAAENDSIVLSKDHGSDKVTGGGALGNIRLMLTVDYALTPNMLLGARFGLVLRSYSGDEAGVDGKRFAVPIHLELRYTYLFGQDPLAKKGIAPYVFGAAGVAQFETPIPVTAIEAKPNVAVQKRDVDAWHIAGPAFFSVGGGIRYTVTPRFAITMGLRGNLAFLNSFAPSIGPEIGGQVGF